MPGISWRQGYLAKILVMLLLIGIATNLYIGDKRVILPRVNDNAHPTISDHGFAWRPDATVAAFTRTNGIARQDTVIVTSRRPEDTVHLAEGRMSWLSDLKLEPTLLVSSALSAKIEHENCCRVSWDGPEEERSIPSCVDTCFTQHACNDPAYPYSSVEEKEAFAPWQPSANETEQLRQVCRQFMANKETKRTSSPRWCHHDNREEEGGEPILDLTNIPTGCSRFGMASFSGPFDRTFLFPSSSEKDSNNKNSNNINIKRLAFCAIPKVGMTQWLQFLRYTIGAVDYQAVPHWKDDVMRLLRFDRMRPEMRTTILKDTAHWTKAVFLRDPAERLLSSYLDKVHDEQGNTTTFEGFVRGLANTHFDCAVDFPTKQSSKEGLSWCSDPHWRPQVWSCGLWELLPHFEFVGAIDTADTATKALLEQVGLWESYGKHYRTGVAGPGQTVCELRPPPPLAPGEEPLGFQQRPAREKGAINESDHGTLYGHNTHSQTKMQRYYTEELLVLVKQLYATDYLLWNALKKIGKNGWATGKDLTRALYPGCK